MRIHACEACITLDTISKYNPLSHYLATCGQSPNIYVCIIYPDIFCLAESVNVMM